MPVSNESFRVVKDKLDAARKAMKPFVELIEMMDRNGYAEGADFILRQGDLILGHAGITVEDLRRIRAASK